MFMIYAIDLSTKNKMSRQGFIFLEKSKTETVGNTKKHFSRFLFQKLTFHIRDFSENAQCFVKAFL